MNGNNLEGFRDQVNDVKERAKKYGRKNEVRCAVNSFVIVGDTEEEAVRVLEEIQGKADKEAVDAFHDAAQQAGASTGNKESKFNHLVQYNDDFKKKLIGTEEQIADRILLLKSLGVNLLLTAFLHYDEEKETFGMEVLPLVRNLEAQGQGTDAEDETARTGEVYTKQLHSPCFAY